MKKNNLARLISLFPLQSRVLIVPLNWGIGHATRCIPIIEELVSQGYHTEIASDGASLQLLEQVFPDLITHSLPSYNIQYSKKAMLFRWKLFSQLLHFYKTYKAERRVINQLVKTQKITIILSDNRFGAFTNETQNIYLTHQLRVKSGITTFFTSLLHRYFFNKFDSIWVPDFAQNPNLSGALSHNINLKNIVEYIGPLSSFKKEKRDFKYDILVLLSGPEPQRSILENKLLQLFKGSDYKICLVKGRIENKIIEVQEGAITIYNYLWGTALQNVLNESKLIIARSGYSTIMDLAILQKKAFFIPTPGQPEQLYLAAHLERQKIAPFSLQNNFSISKLKELTNYSGF